jgi:hypothetical protein
VERSKDGTDHRTFIPTDLRQGLSSYPQIAASALLGRKLESAGRLKSLLGKWNNGKSKRLHPKVRALVGLVSGIAQAEIDKVRHDRGTWFSKVLVFNKLIEGTAPQLREEVSNALVPVFDAFMAELLDEAGIGTVEEIQARNRELARQEMETARTVMLDQFGTRCHVPEDFRHEDLKKCAGRPIWDAYWELLLRRCQQPLFLIRGLLDRELTSSTQLWETWLRRELVAPVDAALRRIVEHYFQDGEETDESECDYLELAEREAVFLLEECRSVDLVGRYDGANSRDRESHRRNFNDFYNPFVLIVSRVGEEGIDLQKQCRYIIHYDLEWNPAKMEQREGRVDRVGWGRSGEKFIDVRFMLLKGTYEERIFHTVMQRDQWFQILIGSKRRELGKIESAEEDDPGSSAAEMKKEQIDDVLERGRLTPAEKAAVMLDLRPQPCVL